MAHRQRADYIGAEVAGKLHTLGVATIFVEGKVPLGEALAQGGKIRRESTLPETFA